MTRLRKNKIEQRRGKESKV